MSSPNANYLINSNKPSTRVHYSPGGASSLSLAWDDTPVFNRPQKARSEPNTHIYKHQTSPQNYNHPV